MPGGGIGIRGKMERAKQSVLALNGSAKMGMGVVIGAGGKEEEDRRERFRRASDGVLFWQKEVGRLEMGPRR